MTSITSPSILRINVSNIVKNYQYIQKIVGPDVRVAAVVKANSYGLGCAEIAPQLAKAGCEEFYVATLSEAIALRKILPTALIFVLSGIHQGEESYFLEHQLIPVLNNMHQIEMWGDSGRRFGKKLPAAIHVDTGMTRLGVEFDRFKAALASLEQNGFIDIIYIISHLACADNHDHEMNQQQLKKFQFLADQHPQYKYSFANSAAVLKGQKDYFFDQVRPGIALYGSNPSLDQKHGIRPVVELKSKIIQIYQVREEQSIGYTASRKLKPGMVVATIPVGYADGYFRSLSNKGYCYINDEKVPIIGIISMDFLSIDITALPESFRKIGQEVELIGKNISVETIAGMADTISYEVLTSLGVRYHKEYIYRG